MDTIYKTSPVEKTVNEDHLINQARSDDVYAFARLYDKYVEQVYRFITFRTENDRVAEDITIWVFCKAWKKLGHYRGNSSSIIAWLYALAQKEITAYYRTHKRHSVKDNTVPLIRSHYLTEDDQHIFGLQTMRDGLQGLSELEQQTLILKFIVKSRDKEISRLMSRRESNIRTLQFDAVQKLTSHLQKTEIVAKKELQQIFEDCLLRLSSGTNNLVECLMNYPKYAEQLEPLLNTVLFLGKWRNLAISPTFNAFARFAIVRYAQEHPHQQLKEFPFSWRTAATLAALVVGLLVTGTAHAQSAMPGDTYYSWKRASESAWRAVAPNPFAVDITLSKRRLKEWVAVANDPILSISSKREYLKSLFNLKSRESDDDFGLIISELQSQQVILNEAGLFASELETILNQKTPPVEAVPVTSAIPVTTGDQSSSTNEQIVVLPPNAPDMVIEKGPRSGVGPKICDPNCGTNQSNNANNSNKNKDKDKDKDKDKADKDKK